MFNLQKIFIWRSFRFRVGKFSEFRKLKKIWKTLNIRFQNYQSQGQKSISSTLPVPCTSGLMHFRWNHKVDPWKVIYKRCRFPCWKSNINCWYFSRLVSNTHFWLVNQWETILETFWACNLSLPALLSNYDYSKFPKIEKFYTKMKTVPEFRKIDNKLGYVL